MHVSTLTRTTFRRNVESSGALSDSNPPEVHRREWNRPQCAAEVCTRLGVQERRAKVINVRTSSYFIPFISVFGTSPSNHIIILEG